MIENTHNDDAFNNYLMTSHLSIPIKTGGVNIGPYYINQGDKDIYTSLLGSEQQLEKGIYRIGFYLYYNDNVINTYVNNYRHNYVYKEIEIK